MVKWPVLLDGYNMEEVVIWSIQFSTLVVYMAQHTVLGISAILIVLLLIQVQRCFVSIMRLKMSGSTLNMEVGFGLAILTCHHMEEGKVPSSMAGSQDALLPIPIGHQVNQTISKTIKIMHYLILIVVYGMTSFLKNKNQLTAAVSTTQL